jgi:hypothetical protein
LPGRAEGGIFVTRGGLRCALPPGATTDASHLVLRASRLGLAAPGSVIDAPLASAVVVEDVTYLGDMRRCTVAAGAERIQVLLPTAAERPSPGASALLFAHHDAIACLAEPPGGA